MNGGCSRVLRSRVRSRCITFIALLLLLVKDVSKGARVWFSADFWHLC